MMLLPVSSPKIRLYLKVFAVDLLYVSVGCVMTWPSPLVGRLSLSSSEASWVGSMMALGAAFGPAITSWMQARLGRKIALLGAGGAFLGSWVILAASEAFPVLCAGRLIGGAAMGIAFIGIPVYLTEISDIDERQAVTTFTEFFLGIGYLIVFFSGPRLSYEALQAVCATITLCFLVVITMLPESPVYLVSKGQKDVALLVLTNLRRSKDQAQKELADIEILLEQEDAADKKKGSLLTLLAEPGHSRALALSIFCLVLQQASGVIVVICYLEPILERLISLTFDVTMAAVIVGCGNLPSVVLSPFMARYLGTKKTLIICSAFMALCVIGFTVYIHLEVSGYDMTNLDWIPILALFLYNVFFCTGLGPLTWCVVAEISPPRIKSFVCFLSSTICWLAAFILLLVFEPARAAFGLTSVFGFFAACLIVGTILIQIVLPDTKGLSMQEIQDVMTGKTKVSSPPEVA